MKQSTCWGGMLSLEEGGVLSWRILGDFVLEAGAPGLLSALQTPLPCPVFYLHLPFFSALIPASFEILPPTKSSHGNESIPLSQDSKSSTQLGDQKACLLPALCPLDDSFYESQWLHLCDIGHRGMTQATWKGDQFSLCESTLTIMNATFPCPLLKRYRYFLCH